MGLEEDVVDVPEEFIIDDLAKCEWYIRKVNALNHDIDTIKANAKAITATLENQLKGLEYRFKGQFKNEIVKHIPHGKKSVKTLWGKAQFKTVKAGIEILDEKLIPSEYFVEKVVFDVDNDKLKIAALKDGVAVPGVEIKPEREELYISE